MTNKKAILNKNATTIYTSTYSGVPVYEMMCGNVSVMRRRSDSFLNATQILKVAGIDKGRRTKILEKEVLNGEHEKVQGGYGKYQGTWIPFQRGVALAKEYDVDTSIKPLLDFEPANIRTIKTQPKEQIARSNSVNANNKKVHGARRKRNSVNSNSNYSNDNNASATVSPINTPNISNSTSTTTYGQSTNKNDTNANEHTAPTPTVNKVIIKKSELKHLNTISNMNIDEENTSNSVKIPGSTPNKNSNINNTSKHSSVTAPSPQQTRKKQRLNNNNNNNNNNSNNNNNNSKNNNNSNNINNNNSNNSSNISNINNGNGDNVNNSSIIYDTTQPSVNMVPSLFQSNMNSFVLPPSRYQNNTLRTYPTVNNPTTYPLNYTLSTENVYNQVPGLVSEKKEKIRASLMEMFLNDDQTSIPDILTTSKLTSDDINMVIDDQGHTALHWAATLARINILKLLIEKGADIKSKNGYGETALIRAVISTHNYDYKSFPELLNLLKNTIIYVDYRGRTLLHHIAYISSKRDRVKAAYYYLEVLLEKMKKNENMYNVIIDFKDQNGDTALNILSRIGNKPMIDLLINFGANPEIENNAGISPLFYGVKALKKDLTDDSDSTSRLTKDELISKTKAYMNSSNEVKVTYPTIRDESIDVKEDYSNPNESLSIKSKSSKILFAVKKAVDEFNESFIQEIKIKDEQLKETQEQLKEVTKQLAEARSIIEQLKSASNISNNKENKDNNKMDIDKENTVEIKKENEYYEEDNSNSSNITDKELIESLKNEIKQLKKKLNTNIENNTVKSITMKEQ